MSDKYVFIRHCFTFYIRANTGVTLMTNRITIRLNAELLKQLEELKNRGIYNLSALVRKCLEEELEKVALIDNSKHQGEL